MITLLIVLVSIAAYLAVGVASCRYTVPRGIKRSYAYNEARWQGLDNRREALDAGGYWKGTTVLFWPFTVPLTACIEFSKPTDSYAPWFHEEQLERRELEVERLEAELGIGTPYQPGTSPAKPGTYFRSDGRAYTPKPPVPRPNPTRRGRRWS